MNITKFHFEPKTFDQAKDFAEIISKSEMVPSDYRGKVGNVLVAIQMGAEIGLPPPTSHSRYFCN